MVTVLSCSLAVQSQIWTNEPNDSSSIYLFLGSNSQSTYFFGELSGSITTTSPGRV
jgi:hypothetical protein